MVCGADVLPQKASVGAGQVVSWLLQRLCPAGMGGGGGGGGGGGASCWHVAGRASGILQLLCKAWGGRMLALYCWRCQPRHGVPGAGTCTVPQPQITCAPSWSACPVSRAAQGHPQRSSRDSASASPQRPACSGQPTAAPAPLLQHI